MKKKVEMICCDHPDCKGVFTAHKLERLGEGESILHPDGVILGFQCLFCQIDLCYNHALYYEFLTRQSNPDNPSTSARVIAPICSKCCATIHQLIHSDQLLKIITFYMKEKNGKDFISEEDLIIMTRQALM